MNRGPLILAGVLGVGLIAGYVALDVAGRDAGEFATFALVLLPALAGLYAADQARQARKGVEDSAGAIETVREQTNGALTGPLADLVTEVRSMKAWMSDHDAVTAGVRSELDQLRAGRHRSDESGSAGSDPE